MWLPSKPNSLKTWFFFCERAAAWIYYRFSTRYLAPHKRVLDSNTSLGHIWSVGSAQSDDLTPLDVSSLWATLAQMGSVMPVWGHRGRKDKDLHWNFSSYPSGSWKLSHIAANTMATKNCKGIKEFPSDVVNLCKLPPKCKRGIEVKPRLVCYSISLTQANNSHEALLLQYQWALNSVVTNVIFHHDC